MKKRNMGMMKPTDLSLQLVARGIRAKHITSGGVLLNLRTEPHCVNMAVKVKGQVRLSIQDTDGLWRGYTVHVDTAEKLLKEAVRLYRKGRTLTKIPGTWGRE